MPRSSTLSQKKMKNVITLIFLLGFISLTAQDNNLIVDFIGFQEQAAAIQATANVPQSNPPSRVIGVRGIAVPEATNGVGVLGTGNTGLFGDGNMQGGTGVFGRAGFRAGWFEGNVYTNGNLEVTGTINGTVVGSSDIKLKRIVNSDVTYLDRLLKLETTKYFFKTDEFETLNLPEREQHGFIAQEMEKVFPHLVHNLRSPRNYDTSGNAIDDQIEYKGINHIGLIPILTKALQELHAENQEYVSRIDKLEEELHSIKMLLTEE